MLLALMHGSATLEIMIFILIFFEELKSQQEFWKDVTFLVVLIFFFSSGLFFCFIDDEGFVEVECTQKKLDN